MTQSSMEPVPEKIVKKSDSVARRTRLREFQAQLVERMQAARSGVDTRSSQLGVMIGQTRWLLSLQEAGEIVSVGKIAHVPLTQDWFLGLTNIRGSLISVVDFSRFHGRGLTPIEKESRIIAFAPGLQINCGLLVSKVMGLRNITEMETCAPEASGIEQWSTASYRDKDSHVWSELNLSLVVQDPRFLLVGI